jgi:hypothetical protein
MKFDGSGWTILQNLYFVLYCTVQGIGKELFPTQDPQSNAAVNLPLTHGCTSTRVEHGNGADARVTSHVNHPRHARVASSIWRGVILVEPREPDTVMDSRWRKAGVFVSGQSID